MHLSASQACASSNALRDKGYFAEGACKEVALREVNLIAIHGVISDGALPAAAPQNAPGARMVRRMGQGMIQPEGRSAERSQAPCEPRIRQGKANPN